MLESSDTMNRKGFTLIELLASIIILGLVGGIVVPGIIKTSNKQREKLYNKQVDEIKKATVSWGMKHLSLLPTKDANAPVYVNINTLVNEECLEENVISPKDEKPMVGCVSITYDLEYNQYTYEYIDQKDANYNVCDNSI